MLLELAIGDAYGAGFEYAPDRLVRECNTVTNYVQHPRHTIHPGCYTDDTQMSIAVAEALVSGNSWERALLANHFVAAFKRDPREGYAGGFYQLLTEVKDGDEFLQRIRADSDKSGAAMRACPIGVLASAEEVIERTRLQAALTHDTPGGTNAAIAAALTTHFFYHRCGRANDLSDFLQDHLPGPWSEPWKGKVGHQGMASVRAAITVVMQHRSLRDLLRSCIAFTGDVDTVATIALAAASCSVEYDHDIPQPLIEALENGPYGRDYLLDLDRRLTTHTVKN